MLICLISEVSSVCLLLNCYKQTPALKLRFQKSKLNSIVQTIIQSNYSVSFKCGSSHMCLKCIRQRCLFWLCLHSYHPDWQKRTKLNLLIFKVRNPTNFFPHFCSKVLKWVKLKISLRFTFCRRICFISWFKSLFSDLAHFWKSYRWLA